MDKSKKKRKKKIIVVSIIVIVIIVAMVNIFKPKEQEKEKIEVEEIAKRSIATSISATGVISTSDTKNFVSTLNGLKITSVNVKEGDKISVGDVICTFDTSSISENLASLNKSLNATDAQGNLTVESAKRGLNDAIANKDKQLSISKTDVDNAQKAYQDAQNALNSAKQDLSNKTASLNNYTTTYTQAKNSYTIIENQYKDLENAYNQAKYAYDAKQSAFSSAEIEYNKYAGGNVPENILTAYNKAKTELDSANIALNTANTNLSNYKATYEQEKAKFTPIQNNYQALSSAVSGAQSNIATLEANVTKLKATYDGTVNAYNTATTTADSQIASMRDSLSGAEISSSVGTETQKMQIKEYQDKLEEGTLKSTVSGTVTKVNVKAGDIYTGSTIATVEGCEEFIVEAEIDEYDIADIKEGMKVIIKTDATREEELEGRVIYTAVSATNSTMQTGMSSATATQMGSAGGNATYTVKIALDTPNERLRLGMNAKLSIITEMKENVWSVPYDSVYTREDGSKYIEIAKNDTGEEKEELDVETGIEGSYYIEVISDKLKAGMKVVLPKIDTNNSVEELIEMMGAAAGV